MMRLTKSTPMGDKYAIRHYNLTVKNKPNYAYAIWSDDAWMGVILFCKPDIVERQFDKWQGQVQEMHIAMEDDADIHTAIEMAIDALRKEAPHVDLVVCRDERSSGNLSLVGRHGSGKKGAYVVNGERLHAKIVRASGWRQSVLWLREHVDERAAQYDRDAEALYAVGLNDSMRARMTKMEVR